jgi:putative ABC transport system permease protein
LPASRYPRDFARFPNFTEIAQFTERTLQAARQLPGVEAAALAAAHPLDEGFTNSWRVVGREAEGADWPEISVRVTSPGYDATMGLRVRSGRAFSEADGGTAPPVALVNATAARRFFAGTDPIGQQLAFWGIPRRIVGVVDDERIHGVDQVAPPAAYVPMAQAPGSSGVLLVRSAREPEALLAELRGVIATVDPQLAVYGAEPFVRTVAATLGQRRFAMMVMGAFALLTVLLALVGVHGMVAYSARQRTRELGIRLALGARPPAVAALVLGGALRLSAAGVALGMVGAFASAGWLAQLLFGVSRHDPATFIGIPAGVLLVALLAGLGPTRRVLRSAPGAALRGTG